MWNYLRSKLPEINERIPVQLALHNFSGGNVEENLQQPKIDIDEITLPPFVEINQPSQFICKSIQEARSVIESISNQDDQDNIKNILIQFQEVFDDFSEDELKQLGLKFKDSNIVVLFESQNGDKFSLIWKSKSIDFFCVICYEHFGEEFEDNDKKIYEFISDFLVCALSHGHLGIRNDIQVTPTSNHIKRDVLADYRGFSLIFIAIESNNTEMFKILLNLGDDVQCSVQGVAAQSLAWKRRHSDVLIIMAQMNLLYPDGIDKNELSDDFKLFYKETEELHEAIIARNNEKVIEILDNRSQNLRYYLNFSNESAAKVAIDVQAVDIYETLIFNEIFLAPHEDHSGVFDNIPKEVQRTLREIHTKNSKDIPDKHINILMVHSQAAYDALDAKGNLKYVKQAYKLLSQDPRLNIILRVVAAAKKFTIIYDFNRDAVHVLDPTTGGRTEGIFYPKNGRIFIGARQLLDETKKFQAISVMIHELCHFAVNLAFDNNAKPYKQNDAKTSEEFAKIVFSCFNNRKKEEIVDLVYEEYPPEHYHAELIVRFPHMLVLYHNQPEVFQEKRESFHELCEFYEKSLVPSLEKAIPEIESRDEKESQKKDEKITKLKKIVIAVGILSIIGIIFAVFIASRYSSEPVYKFNELSKAKKLRVRNGNINYKGASVQFKDLLLDNSNAYEELTSELITQIFSGKELNSNDSRLSYLDGYIEHNWRNMTINLKERMFNSNFLFQNEAYSFIKLHNSTPVVFNYLTSNEIKRALNNKEITVGNMIANSTTFFVERRFFKREKSYNLKTLDPFLTKKDYENFNRKEIEQFFRMKLIKEDIINDKIEIFVQKRKDNHDYFFDVNIIHDLKNVTNLASKQKLFILSSEAGAGKTVVFQQSAIKLKRTHPDYWVSYIELKNHTEKYNISGNVEDHFKLLKDILNLNENNMFEMKIFEECYRTGKVILLWNGFDEISPTYSSFIINVVEEIKKSSNIQYICTRPLYAEKLKNAFRIESLDLLPYTLNEQKEFLLKFFKSKKFNEIEGKRQTEKVLSVTNKLSLTTPLMLILIADIAIQQKHSEIHISTDGNSTIEKLNVQKIFENENLYYIYETFVSNKIKIFLEKGDAAANVTKSLLGSKINVRLVYQKYAILGEFQDLINPRVKKLKILQEKFKTEGFNLTQISHMGILTLTDDDKFEFTHKTFAEFFVAEYLIQHLTSTNQADLDEIIFDLCYEIRNRPMIINFMNDYLEGRSDNQNDKLALSNLLRNKHKYFILENQIDLGSEYPKMLLKFFRRDHNLLLDLLSVKENSTLYTEAFNPIYLKLGKTNHPQTVKEFGKLFLTGSDLDRFLMGRNQKGVISFNFAAIKSFNVEGNYSADEIKPIIISDPNLENFFENIKSNLTFSEQRELLKFMMSFPLLSCNDTFRYDYNEMLWKRSKNLLSKKELVKVIGTALRENGVYECFDNTNEYLKMVNFYLKKIIKFFTDQEMIEIFRNEKVLHKATLRDVEIVEKLWNFFSNHTTKDQRKRMLLEYFYNDGTAIRNLGYMNKLYEARYPYTMFHYSTFFDEDQSLKRNGTFDTIIKLYDKFLQKRELKSLILSSNEFLIHTISESTETMLQKLCNYLKVVFKKDEERLSEYLNMKVEPSDFNITSYFSFFQFRYEDKLKIIDGLKDNLYLNKKVKVAE